MTLHFDSNLKGRWDFALLLGRIEAELDGLADWFGFTLRRRPVVFLYSSWQKLPPLLGRPAGGLALALPNAILVGDNTNHDEFLRHELAHLFAFRLKTVAPPLFAEGLAVWLAGTYDGLHLNSAARIYLDKHSVSLSLLLRRSMFYSSSNQAASYVLAGSFTGFLITRYGWKKYRKCYRTADCFFFRKTFRKVFGVTLEEAEGKWRNALAIEQSPSVKVCTAPLKLDHQKAFVRA